MTLDCTKMFSESDRKQQPRVISLLSGAHSAQRLPCVKGERCERRRWRMKRPERVAAVEKIEDQRKPDDFFGYRNRSCRAISTTEGLSIPPLDFEPALFCGDAPAGNASPAASDK